MQTAETWISSQHSQATTIEIEIFHKMTVNVNPIFPENVIKFDVCCSYDLCLIFFKLYSIQFGHQAQNCQMKIYFQLTQSLDSLMHI